jgi:hypothetical protein
MHDIPSKRVLSYLDTDNNELTSIFAKINELQKLNSKIANYLDPHLVPYCQIANLIKNKLIILVANGSIATQLRFQNTLLLKKFSMDPDLQHIFHIECKVQPNLAQPLPGSNSRQVRKIEPLSLDAAQVIREMAKTLKDDSLRDVMERIASRTSETTRS